MISSPNELTMTNRDPWWIFTVVNLFWNIKTRYEFGYFELMRISSRFGIMLLSMCLSILFVILDVLAVTSVLQIGGLNPFWKLAFVFKCFTDTIILDDFKTALDKLSLYRRNKIRGSFSFSDPDSALADRSRRRSAPLDAGGGEEPQETSMVSHASTDIQSVDVDKIEAVGPMVSPRSTFSGPRKVSKEWWEHESYASYA